MLIYIGHEDLHRKLDFSKHFYEEPNRKLGNTVIRQFLNPADGRLTKATVLAMGIDPSTMQPSQ